MIYVTKQQKDSIFIANRFDTFCRLPLPFVWMIQIELTWLKNQFLRIVIVRTPKSDFRIVIDVILLHSEWAWFNSKKTYKNFNEKTVGLNEKFSSSDLMIHKNVS